MEYSFFKKYQYVSCLLKTVNYFKRDLYSHTSNQFDVAQVAYLLLFHSSYFCFKYLEHWHPADCQFSQFEAFFPEERFVVKHSFCYTFFLAYVFLNFTLINIYFL